MSKKNDISYSANVGAQRSKNFIKNLKILSIITIILSVMMIVIGWFWHKNKGSNKDESDKEDKSVDATSEKNKKIEDDILSEL